MWSTRDVYTLCKILENTEFYLVNIFPYMGWTGGYTEYNFIYKKMLNEQNPLGFSTLYIAAIISNNTASLVSSLKRLHNSFSNTWPIVPSRHQYYPFRTNFDDPVALIQCSNAIFEFEFDWRRRRGWKILKLKRNWDLLVQSQQRNPNSMAWFWGLHF